MAVYYFVCLCVCVLSGVDGKGGVGFSIVGFLSEFCNV